MVPTIVDTGFGDWMNAFVEQALRTSNNQVKGEFDIEKMRWLKRRPNAIISFASKLMYHLCKGNFTLESYRIPTDKKNNFIRGNDLEDA